MPIRPAMASAWLWIPVTWLALVLAWNLVRMRRQVAASRSTIAARSASSTMSSRRRGPRLVGLAYSFQVVPHIPMTATDVFMDTIVTDRGIDELLAHEDGAIDLRSR